MAESVMDARYARAAGWSARFLEAVPAAVLGAVLVALIGLIAWIAVSVVNLHSDVKTLDARVTALETRVDKGFEQTNERLSRLEASVKDLNDKVIDIYKLLAERLPPPQEQTPQQR